MGNLNTVMTKTTQISLNIQAWHKILIVGGGQIAMAKYMFFKDYSQNITIVAKDVIHEFKEVIARENVKYIQDDYNNLFSDKTKLLEWFIVVVACNNDQLNKHIHQQVYGTNILLNIVDNSSLSTFHLPAVVKRNDLQVSISTNGKSPAFARWLKAKLESILNFSHDNLLDFMGNKRDLVKSKLKDSQARRLFWYDFLELTASKKSQSLQSLLDECLQGYMNNQHAQAKLYLIGVGSGDPENITLKAIHAIAKADVILYDRLIPKDILNFYARSEALKIYVGKKRGDKLMQQENINDLIRKHVANNKIVARVKGGDTAVFSRVGDEINIAKETNTAYELIPGISAMSGCTAQAKFPLTLKGVSSSIKVMTIYKDDINDNKKWQYLDPNETIVFYMSIRYLHNIGQKLQEQNFAPTTPIAIIENGTTSEHREYYSTLENIHKDYANHEFKNPSLILVGRVINILSSNHGI